MLHSFDDISFVRFFDGFDGWSIIDCKCPIDAIELTVLWFGSWTERPFEVIHDDFNLPPTTAVRDTANISAKCGDKWFIMKIGSFASALWTLISLAVNLFFADSNASFASNESNLTTIHDDLFLSLYTALIFDASMSADKNDAIDISNVVRFSPLNGAMPLITMLFLSSDCL